LHAEPLLHLFGRLDASRWLFIQQRRGIFYDSGRALADLETARIDASSVLWS